MAGPDKKEQKLGAREPSSTGMQTLVVQDPDVAHFIMSGVPQGLISREFLNSDQTTTISTWAVHPDPGDTDYFRLQIARAGSNEWTQLQELSFTGGNTWVPLVFTIPKTFFLNPANEGEFDLRYEHENFVNIKDYSNRVRIHIDKTPPNGAIPPKKMVFTVTGPITDATFAGNDYIEATIPVWEGDILDVQVAFGWIKGDPTAGSVVRYIVDSPIHHQ